MKKHIKELAESINKIIFVLEDLEKRISKLEEIQNGRNK